MSTKSSLESAGERLTFHRTVLVGDIQLSEESHLAHIIIAEHQQGQLIPVSYLYITRYEGCFP